MEVKREVKVVEYIEYDGIRFYRDKRGYWLSSRIKGIDRPKRLHHYVWEKFNGPIPERHHVHHIDHDTDNNEIENLELVEQSEHLKHHAKFQDKEWCRNNLNEVARPKAIEWHKSEQGREWHRKHYENTREKLHKRVTITCKMCGKEVDVGLGGMGNKFCSNACKSQYRRKIGIDNVEVSCEWCGGKFYTNKYTPAKYCSKECRLKGRHENKKNRNASEC